MAEIVRMPKLSDTMTEGVVAEWHKKVGDNIESGELLAEIETDKATMEFDSFQEGVLLHIGVQKGDTAPVDSILAILGEKGEDIAKLLEEEKSTNAKVDEKEIEKPTEIKAVAPKDNFVQPSIPAAQPATNKVIATNNFPSAESNSDIDVKASPLAKKLADEKGINLKFVNGTGTEGRIIKRDIDNFQGKSIVSGQESFQDEPVSQMRKVIAQRLAESKFTAPHFYLTVSIDMDNAILARKSINSSISPSKISFNDFVESSSGHEILTMSAPSS